MRGVPAAYRMSGGSKPAPKAPSPYIQTVFKPLRAVLAPSTEHPDRLLAFAHKDDALRFVAYVLGECWSSVDSSTSTIIANMAQMDASLQWLRQADAGRAGGGGLGSASGVNSESENIGQQMLLDVRQMARDSDALLALCSSGTSAASASASAAGEGGVVAVGSSITVTSLPAYASAMERLQPYARTGTGT